MCSRYSLTSPPEAVRSYFGTFNLEEFPPRYNIAPTQPIPAVIVDNGARRFVLLRWGLLPAWVKDPRKFTLLINARAETVLEKPAFRNAMKRRRCLVPADGYYEWQTVGARKRPLFVHPSNGQAAAFAALAETWSGHNGEEVDTAAIITVAASPDLAPLHPRMPAVIAPEAFAAWLDCRGVSDHEAAALLVAPPEGTFAWHEVSGAVNRVSNDDPGLIAPVGKDEIAAAAASAAAKRPERPRAVRTRTDADQGSLF